MAEKNVPREGKTVHKPLVEEAWLLKEMKGCPGGSTDRVAGGTDEADGCTATACYTCMLHFKCVCMCLVA